MNKPFRKLTTLQKIISSFSLEKWTTFFRNASDTLTFPNTFFSTTPPFSEGTLLAEGKIGEKDLLVAAFLSDKTLSERSGKKKQYELGKKILKEKQADAGIFIFHDRQGNFRLSLITVTYRGPNRDFSHFKRTTYFVSKEYTNKTFLKQIGDADFSSLEKLKEAFSVEKVTKEFYQDIANWYFWALKHVQFPPSAEMEPGGRNVAVIRLITRLVFIWFMKQKSIVPAYLFDHKKTLPEILKDLSSESSTYYQAILQNLFFATLNTRAEERRFREEKRFRKGWNKDFGNQYVYRYHSLFRNPEKIEVYFENIPFLNGGLFECLDDGSKDIYIDGFTERSKKYQPYVPNFLFFSEEKIVDLSKDYGASKFKRAKVRGLIDILQSYSFTIDENAPEDEEVALDPELLGKVFENLLASYNPETATTARKATGSYYTPREIVDYMVTESLKDRFLTLFPRLKREKMEVLFSYDNGQNPLTPEETEKLISAIQNVKIIDPAVGSGAFPMGILRKLVHILHKLDPHNEKWKSEQIRAVELNVKDPALKQDLTKKIEEDFALNELDYGRKLYLIQNCLYGVDIQPIAIQIAKLRFFISLLVDVKIDKEKENWCIDPLPNLETRFVAANTLIGLERPAQAAFQTLEITALEEELKRLRASYFSAWDVAEKEKIRKEDAKIRRKLAEALEEHSFPSDTTEKITHWDPYNTNLSADWFDPEWMFGVTDGFDVVIGNPPYVSYGLRGGQKMTKSEKNFLRKHFPNSAEYKISLYAIFIDRGMQIAKPDGGIETYIVPDSFLLGRYFSKIRKNILGTCKIQHILLLPFSVFQATVGFSVVYVFQKEKNVDRQHRLTARYATTSENVGTKTFKQYSYNQSYFSEVKHNRFRLFFDRMTMDLITKIEEGSNELACYLTGRTGVRSLIGQKKIVAKEKKGTTWQSGLVSGSQIVKYKVIDEGYYININPKLLNKGGWDYAVIHNPKMLVRQTGDSLIAAIDYEGFYHLNNIHSFAPADQNDNRLDILYLLAIFNSNLMNFYYGKISLEAKRAMAQTDIETLESLPIKEILKDEQQPFISLVNKILAITSRPDYDPKGNTALNHQVYTYEKQIEPARLPAVWANR